MLVNFSQEKLIKMSYHRSIVESDGLTVVNLNEPVTLGSNIPFWSGEMLDFFLLSLVII